MGDPGASTAQQQLFPHPPPYFKLYRGEADGSAERPFPPLPPPPVVGEYVLFGEVHTVRKESVERDLLPIKMQPWVWGM